MLAELPDLQSAADDDVDDIQIEPVVQVHVM